MITMKCTVKKAFAFYHDGCTPTQYEVGEQDIPQDAFDVAVSEGWAVGSAPEAKAKKEK